MENIIHNLILVILGIGMGVLSSLIINRRIIKTTSQSARKLLEHAKDEAKQKLREAELECKDIIYQTRLTMQEEYNRKNEELTSREKILVDREQTFSVRSENLEKREELLVEKRDQLLIDEGQFKKRVEQVEKSLDHELKKLLHACELKQELAKEILFEYLEKKYEKEIHLWKSKQDSLVRSQSAYRAKEILLEAIQTCLPEIYPEVTTSVVSIDDESIKGKIIGKDGKNIRAFERITGVNLVIDDTPEVVILSSFDGLKREIAKISLEKLIKENRLNPVRIDEVVKQVKQNMEKKIREIGDKAVAKVGLEHLPLPLINRIGSMKFFIEGSHNLLQHSLEVSMIMGKISDKMGLDPILGKRIGLLHDVCKVISFMNQQNYQSDQHLFEDLGESNELKQVIQEHHEKANYKSLYTMILDIANTVSLTREGSNFEEVSTYIEQLEEIETEIQKVQGIIDVQVFQSGKLIQVLVNPDKITDADLPQMSEEIKSHIQKIVQNPIPIKLAIKREIIYSNSLS